MAKLKVLIEKEWEYVFCRNELKVNPITTKDKTKAIRGDKNSLQYFERYFGNHIFKVE